jgi:NADH:ubiquinone oxidoreductase subunit 4 (subunit M)
MHKSTENEVAIYIYKSFCIVFLLVGSFCNFISAFIYSKKKMRKTSYSTYLLALAIVDMSVTWVGNTRLFFMFFEFNTFQGK